MKLAALGVVTVIIGFALGVPGLIGVGALWTIVGPPMRRYGQRLEKVRDGAQGSVRPAIDGRSFAVGTLLWLLLGIPSLAVGVLGIGIGAENEAWRWLPIVVGGLALGIGATSGVLYFTGSAIHAVAERIPNPSVAATVWIREVRETGAYVNERPRLELVLRVDPDAGADLAGWEVTKKATVPFTALSALRVGDGFRALVSGPDDPTSMEIHWDQPVSTGSTDVGSRLDELDRLHREDRITLEEYETERKRILGSI